MIKDAINIYSNLVINSYVISFKIYANCYYRYELFYNNYIFENS